MAFLEKGLKLPSLRKGPPIRRLVAPPPLSRYIPLRRRIRGRHRRLLSHFSAPEGGGPSTTHPFLPYRLFSVDLSPLFGLAPRGRGLAVRFRDGWGGGGADSEAFHFDAATRFDAARTFPNPALSCPPPALSCRALLRRRIRSHRRWLPSPYRRLISPGRLQRAGFCCIVCFRRASAHCLGWRPWAEGSLFVSATGGRGAGFAALHVSTQRAIPQLPRFPAPVRPDFRASGKLFDCERNL